VGFEDLLLKIKSYSDKPSTLLVFSSSKKNKTILFGKNGAGMKRRAAMQCCFAAQAGMVLGIWVIWVIPTSYSIN